MADPIWLDTNVAQRALRGDIAVVDQLKRFQDRGRTILITQKVGSELLYGQPVKDKYWVPKAPTPESQRAMSLGLSKLGIEIDQKSFAIPDDKMNKYRAIQENNVSYPDRTVLAEIKASAEMRGVAKPQMITAEQGDKGMSSKPGFWGIEKVAAEPYKGGGVPNAGVNLKDYPPDEDGPILKYFKDNPFIEKLTMTALNLGAQYISKKMMSEVMDHFKDEVRDAEKALNVAHPDPTQLRTQAGLDPYKRAFDNALSQVSAAETARIYEAVILAFTRDSDIDAVKAQLDKQIIKVKSAADGKLSSFGKVAGEYVDALASLYKKVTSSASGLDDIANGVEKRARVVKSAAEALEQLFWKYVPVVAAFPLASYEWLNVYNVADSLGDVSETVFDFAHKISDRLTACEKILDDLDRELQRVSDAVYKFGV